MRLPATVLRSVEDVTGSVVRIEPVAGGCIANAGRVEAERGTFFLKWGSSPGGDTFESEAAGLAALTAARSPLLVPEVLLAADAGDQAPGHLLLSWIEPGRPGGAFGRRLGEGLAALHRSTEEQGRYGFERDNFIGRLSQRNDWFDSWPAFFGDMRLQPQIEMARSAGRWKTSWDLPADRLLDLLPDLLPASPPASICHGDLWSGNVICAVDGRPTLIDPAAYYGHGEADLAMMALFGGFDPSTFEGYFEQHPRESGHVDREAIYQLYHLINHLNHFGEGYSGSVERVIRAYGR